jgi:hypothetical protein
MVVIIGIQGFSTPLAFESHCGACLANSRQGLAKACQGHWRIPLGLEKVAPLW